MASQVTVARGETDTTTVQLDAQKCTYTRDGLTKAIYSTLFEWSVSFINEQLGSEQAAVS